jgi:hypothetical protein
VADLCRGGSDGWRDGDQLYLSKVPVSMVQLQNELHAVKGQLDKLSTAHHSPDPMPVAAGGGCGKPAEYSFADTSVETFPQSGRNK